AVLHAGRRIDSLRELPDARVVLLDLAPTELLRIGGETLPQRYRRALARYRYGGAACKVDLALSAPVPWRNPDCAAAGTLHLIGGRPDALQAELAVARGEHADRPFVLLAQPGAHDESRAPRGITPVWTYAHVPRGSDVDASAAVLEQLERFAPGVRDLVLATSVRTARELGQDNANYPGGDIGAGAVSLRQLVFRPTVARNPYATPLNGVYLCSAATPPGAGVHGMAGTHAAAHALRERFGITTDPLRLLATTR
ncbi:MAG: phytoene desaturase family protein, partial [Sciscionella sp.]